MGQWVYFIPAPREDFAATMSEDEKAVFAAHWDRLLRLHAEGTVTLAGPALGRTNTGIAVIEAPDEQTAHRLMAEDTTIASGPCRGELRGFHVAVLRERDGGTT
jgi:uncharacterized protein YciI